MNKQEKIDYQRKVLDIIKPGEPYEAHELWYEVSHGNDWDEFDRQMKDLEEKKMVSSKKITVYLDLPAYQRDDGDYDSYENPDVTLYWAPYYQETIDQQKEATTMAKAYIGQAITDLRKSIDDMDKDWKKKLGS